MLTTRQIAIDMLVRHVMWRTPGLCERPDQCKPCAFKIYREVIKLWREANAYG